MAETWGDFSDQTWNEADFAYFPDGWRSWNEPQPDQFRLRLAVGQDQVKHVYHKLTVEIGQGWARSNQQAVWAVLEMNPWIFGFRLRCDFDMAKIWHVEACLSG